MHHWVKHVDLDALDKQISRIDHTYTTFTTTPTIPTTRNTQVAEVGLVTISPGHYTSNVVYPLTNQSTTPCIYPASGTHL
jgi:hypothetical protein